MTHHEIHLLSNVSFKIEISNQYLIKIGAIADELHVEAHAVGGYVRDKILGKEVSDIDIVVVGDGIAFAHEVGRRLGQPNIVEYGQFGTAMLPIDGGKIEFVTAREESYSADSRKPTVTAATLESDLSRRDFTVNALAACLNVDRFGVVTDPFNGMADMEAKLLRTPLDPEKTFDDDPLRMMRAVRFAAKLEFVIDPAAFKAITVMADRIKIVSKERVSDEFLKILQAAKPSIGLLLLQQSGLSK